MRKLLALVCGTTLVFAGTFLAGAQDKSTASNQSKEVQKDTKTMTRGNTTKTSTDTVYGKVENDQPGKSINVTVPGAIVSTKTFTLDSKDETVNVASSIKNGDWVSVAEKTDNNGHKTVTVKPSTEKQAASRMKKTSQ
jgi:hypothetical protein